MRLFPLEERFHLCLNDEVILAQSAAPLFGNLDPLQEAVVVHVLDGASAEAGGDEIRVLLSAEVANLADSLHY